MAVEFRPVRFAPPHRHTQHEVREAEGGFRAGGPGGWCKTPSRPVDR